MGDAIHTEKNTLTMIRLDNRTKGEWDMDYHQLTAPCGLDCFNCAFFLAPEDPEAKAQIETVLQRRLDEVEADIQANLDG